jgi:SAM-dependent methyltransferase
MSKFNFINVETGELVIQDNSSLPSDFEVGLRNANSSDVLRMLFPSEKLLELESKLFELESYEKLSANQFLDVELNYQDRVLFNLATLTHSEFTFLNLIDAIYEPTSQYSALKLLLEKRERGTFVQVGGNGIHAIKSLLTGFDTAILVTPVKSELVRAFELADLLGIRERLFGYIGFGENLPLQAETVDCVYFGGCLHHTNELKSWRESLRILRPGGISLAVESFEAPLYKFGIKIFGKREKEVNCIILNKQRLEDMTNCFNDIKYVKSGFIFRYVFIAAFSRVKSIAFHGGLIQLQLTLDKLTPNWVNRIFGSSIVIFQEKI